MRRRLLILGLVLALLMLAGIGLILKLGRAAASPGRLRPGLGARPVAVRE